MRLIEIAEKLDCLLEGEGEIEIKGVASLEQARPGDLTFLSNPKYTPLLKTTQASAVLVRKDFGSVPLPALRCSDPYLLFAKALEFFYTPPRPSVGVHSTAVIAPTARIGANAVVLKDVAAGVTMVGIPARQVLPRERGDARPDFHAYGTPGTDVGDPTITALDALSAEIARLRTRLEALEGGNGDAVPEEPQQRRALDDRPS